MARLWLSIIIPVRNETEGICDTLASLQTWRRQGVEILLVDGDSSDNTVDLARPLVDQLIICRPGRARQMNLGAKQAQASVLWFLHADSRLTGPAVEFLQQWLEEKSDGKKNVRKDAVGKQSVEQRGENALFWGRFDISLSGQHYLFSVIATLINWRSAISGIATGDQGIFVSRALFVAVGGYQDMPLMEDVALSARLRQRVRPLRAPCFLETSSRRWQQKGVWRTIGLMWWLRLRFFLGTSVHALHRLYDR